MTTFDDAADFLPLLVRLLAPDREAEFEGLSFEDGFEKLSEIGFFQELALIGRTTDQDGDGALTSSESFFFADPFKQCAAFQQDLVDFMQFVPASPTETTLRYINYGLPDGRREMKALRYLNWRINRLVNLEDKDLIERVQAGMASSSYAVGPLGEGEVCLRSFGRRMRALFPEMRERAAPPKGWSFHRKPAGPQ